ncbi:MAG: galactokinase [Chloroflexi bacterium]|nr:galactokinase [Chloroflexota bacterium]
MLRGGEPVDRDQPPLMATTIVAEAHGRVNLIGEHTDYNGGFVLPTIIPQCTRVELSPRDDRTVRVSSQGFEQGAAQTYQLGVEAPGRGWLDYVQGVTATLRAEGFRLRGFEARVSSSVPVGGGLSSSAALEVSLLRALRAAFALAIDDVRLALIGQQAENEFVGARVGVLDQLAASLADASSALFIDTRSLEHRRVLLPREADLVVVHSGLTHSHASGEYNARRAECERACALLGVAQLRDLSLADLPRLAALPDPLRRRARHVVTENARVLAAVAAMERADLRRLGQLLLESHVSMRDDYEVSVPEIDLLVELACDEPDVFGARLTGGGFGGSVVILARRGAGGRVARRICAAYRESTTQRPAILVSAPVSGV